MGFRYSVPLLPAIQATELLILTLAGLTPAEHPSLRWTHNRTFGFLPLKQLFFKVYLLLLSRPIPLTL